MFDHFQMNTQLRGRGRRFFPGVALVHERDLGVLVGGLLHGFGQLRHLRPVLLVGRGHLGGQQMPQRFQRRVHFGAFAFLMAVEARARLALRRRLHSATVHNYRAVRAISVADHAQQEPQIMRHDFKAAGPQPALGLLLNHPPRRQIVGYHVPGASRAHQPAQRVEHRAQGVRTLWRFLRHQGEVRSAELRFFRKVSPFLPTVCIRHWYGRDIAA